jgi:hypothetical protein
MGGFLHSLIMDIDHSGLGLGHGFGRMLPARSCPVSWRSRIMGGGLIGDRHAKDSALGNLGAASTIGLTAMLPFVLKLTPGVSGCLRESPCAGDEPRGGKQASGQRWPR